VPLEAISRDADGAFAYVDRDDRIARAAIELGAMGDDRAEVTSGLEEGDVVLVGAPGEALPEGRGWRPR
jgi:hypothetical protein